MKTYKNLFSDICSFDNLYRAYRRARKGKRGSEAAATFELRLEEHLFHLQRQLLQKSYRAGDYNSFYIHEPKRRLISAAPFCDRVVHHALCPVIEPLFERRFISDSYANRKGKGTHRALDCCTYFARRWQYVLQCDVRQFFPSIDHEILKRIVRRVIADRDVMWLVDRILESGIDVLSEEYDTIYFPGDDLFDACRPRGLPIGNLTSQFWANCYLNELDQFVKRKLCCCTYIRYVDDFLLFSDDKEILWQWREAIIRFLRTLRLTIHENRAHPRPVTEGIPFLGFLVFPAHRRLKRRNAINYQRTLRRLMDRYAAGEIEYRKILDSIRGWVNHASFGDTYGLRRSLLWNMPISMRRT